MSLADKIKSIGPKKILALDGGGIRGILTVEVLAKIEHMLRHNLRRGNDFVLADYLDLFSGTSTGAPVAMTLTSQRIARPHQRMLSGMKKASCARNRIPPRGWPDQSRRSPGSRYCARVDSVD